MKIHVTTDGCEVGRLSSQNIYRFFSTFDAEIVYTSDPKEADLIVFYACGLTKGQEEKSMGLIAAFKKEAKPSARIVVWGCLPKQNPELLKMGFDGPLIGPSDSQAFEEIIAEMVEVPKISSSLEIPDVHIPITQMLSNESPVKLGYLRHILSRAIFFGFESSPYYVRIAEGCTSHCTYCSEHLVWGDIKSKEPHKIISEFQAGLKKGHRLFELCAEDVGAYGVDIGLDAIKLLEQLVNLSNDPGYKIIINQLSPVYLSKMFWGFDKIFATGKISRLGVQVESGSDRILKLMGRSQCKASDWRKMMLYINRKYPRINLATHFMVGFPTEKEEDFKATMGLMNFPLFLKNITVYKFWANPHVPAVKLKGQIPEYIIKTRADRLQRRFYLTYFLNLAMRNSYALSNINARQCLQNYDS